ncbi:MAG: hypothetical protein A2932_01245 [Candidatus Spechtbacteria bacterium RIFCSPLOWO2_01_FULL_46_10]|uniref:Antitoxin n=1 Tax=Candidatus Spechtbacteria bacterium RIFCSPLOWO2_01_FULL_46_10 TaxID=1802163 RepID=A0A1G2HGF4_9BACT|nr:MAG: hypothetical protein A2932_01245 [Candidatus Spechtbacteria bacterium RIFCSPLOWO2_01_FULL_46_10]
MWESLKKILKDSGERAIIVEDGAPRYVLLSVDEYMRLRVGTSQEQTQTITNQRPPQQDDRQQTVDFATPAPYTRDRGGMNAEFSSAVEYEPVGDEMAAELNIEDLPF